MWEPGAVDGRIIFDRHVDGRAKTGRGAIGTLSRRTERLVSAYLTALGTERLPYAMLFRTRSGKAYQDARLSRDFETVRELVLPGDKRRLMDMRRSGAVEAIAGGADAVGFSAKLAKSIGRSNALHKTYAPVGIQAVRDTNEARRQGRRKMRDGNEKEAKISTQQPQSVSTGEAGGAK